MANRLALVCVTTLTLGAAASAQAQTRDGWSLNWQDTFDGTSIDLNRWSVLSRQDSYNNEKQYYTPNAVTVSGGQLKIKASNTPLANKAYQSGLVQTKTLQTYGRWEVNASLPATQGMWPAIWLLPPAPAWPQGGEIDIMENRGSAPTIVGSAYHYGSSVANHQYVSKDFSYTATNGTPVSFQNSTHNYAVEWDPNRIRYFMDGVPSLTLYQATGRGVSSSPMSLILNLAVGGDFGGDPNSSTVFPQTFAIDDVRNYSRNAATANIANRGFESAAGSLLTDWDEYSNGANVGLDETPSNSRSGSGALKLYGRFNGAANTSGVYQEIPTTAGTVVQFDAWAKNRPNDKLLGANEGRIKIDFIDANGNVINVAGNTGSISTTNAASSTVYRQYAVRRVAPANAVFARAVVEVSQVNNAGGAFDADDVNLRAASGSLTGDIDLNGVRNSSDVDLLLHSLFATNNGAFDFDGNGLVNRGDVTRLLGTAFNTTDGDLNLDGRVDRDDLNTFIAHYGDMDTGTWAVGDFTGDGNVNWADRQILAEFYGLSGDTTTAAGDTNFNAAWNQAISAPEPASMLAFTGIAFILAGRRRRTAAAVGMGVAAAVGSAGVSAS